MRATMLLLPLLVGCQLFDKAGNDTALEPWSSPTVTTSLEYQGGFLEGEFCAVQSIVQIACVTGCHSAVVAEGGLNLEYDPYNAMVFQPSTQNPGQTLVVPRDPDASYLYQKMLGTGPTLQGAVMPPGGALDPYFLVPVRDWILAGTPNDCAPPEFGTVTTPPPGEPHHPPGWAASNVHGLAAKLQTDGDCRGCHGQYLDGETNGVSCDTCHTEAGYPEWRNDCTFCHGGGENQTGAPPKDIDGQTDPAQISFPSHTEHVAGYDHKVYGCDQCHSKPVDVLTPGHIFDDQTAGYGELYYANGYAPESTYFQGTCSNVYCHGDGYLALGEAYTGMAPLGCYGCHPDITTPQEWNQMSGRHQVHLNGGVVTCYECHSTVVDANQVVVNPDYHVDGQRQVQPLDVVWNGATCTGTCHNHDHNNDAW
jgi:predicted CxxxxCH...CXXCH cytochrome family protein